MLVVEGEADFEARLVGRHGRHPRTDQKRGAISAFAMGNGVFIWRNTSSSLLPEIRASRAVIHPMDLFLRAARCAVPGPWRAFLFLLRLDLEWARRAGGKWCRR